MVPITALWLPILLAPCLVFIASSLIHMVLPFHQVRLQPGAEGRRVHGRRAGSSICPPVTTLRAVRRLPQGHDDPQFIEKMQRPPSWS